MLFCVVENGVIFDSGTYGLVYFQFLWEGEKGHDSSVNESAPHENDVALSPFLTSSSSNSLYE